ncbi:uncharacterized protein LOC106637305 isoform X2 [Copidosoma floridanum]|uniref:uncharacterized protein LOC106637305 isoform X2 n=1 Tax=Copidosoma floridanum TaxID=29053 RepID=UPI0006C9C90B|nr:uncharacterized protein LOC106637305 isoform X2 [Copidosoma floridanum]
MDNDINVNYFATSYPHLLACPWFFPLHQRTVIHTPGCCLSDGKIRIFLPEGTSHGEGGGFSDHAVESGEIVIMIQVSGEGDGGGYNCCCPNVDGNNKYEKLGRKSLAYLANLFKPRRGGFVATPGRPASASSCLAGMRIDEDTMHRSSAGLENTAVGGMLCNMTRPRSAPGHQVEANAGNTGISKSSSSISGGGSNDGALSSSPSVAVTGVSRIPSSLSVTAVDVVVACGRQASNSYTLGNANGSRCSSNYNSRGASPSHSSILTLTPGRTRNIDQDMEALRLSRQDNPFVKVLASKESLIEPVEEYESDLAILMSQEMVDLDPLTLTQVHKHLVRSPPPASWSHSPVFHFPHQQHPQQPQHSPGSKSDSGAHYRTISPKPGLLHRPTQDDQPKSEGSMETRDRHSHTFSLLNPTPIRRMHRSEDSVQLMSSE